MMQCTLLVDEVERLMWDVSQGAIKYTPVFANGHAAAKRNAPLWSHRKGQGALLCPGGQQHKLLIFGEGEKKSNLMEIGLERTAQVEIREFTGIQADLYAAGSHQSRYHSTIGGQALPPK